MAGLYLGGNRYELRFVPLADFSAAPAAGDARAPAGAGRRRAAGRAALRRAAGAALPRSALQLVQLLRFLGRLAPAPHDDVPPATPRSLSPPRACALLLLAGWPGAACPGARRGLRPAGPDGHAGAGEVRRGDVHRRPARAAAGSAPSARPAACASPHPDTFVRETLQPRHERLAVVGNQLTMSARQPHADGPAGFGAGSGGDRRGDPRHADRQPRDRWSATSTPPCRAARSSGSWSWCRAIRACAARSTQLRLSGRQAPGARSAHRRWPTATRSVMRIEPLAAGAPARP